MFNKLHRLNQILTKYNQKQLRSFFKKTKKEVRFGYSWLKNIFLQIFFEDGKISKKKLIKSGIFYDFSFILG